MWLALANGTIANVLQGVTWEMSGEFSFLASLGDPCNFHHVNKHRRAWWTMRNTWPCHPHHLRWHWVNVQTCEGGHAGPLAPGKPAQVRTTQPKQGIVKTMNVCYFKQVVHYLAKANWYKGITSEVYVGQIWNLYPPFHSFCHTAASKCQRHWKMDGSQREEE